MTITPRVRVAAAVAAIRQLDAENGTDTAITDVAETLHLDPADVAQIAREEAHDDALREDQHRALADVGASSLDLGNFDFAQVGKSKCRGCGACKRNKAVEA